MKRHAYRCEKNRRTGLIVQQLTLLSTLRILLAVIPCKSTLLFELLLKLLDCGGLVDRTDGLRLAAEFVSV
jgi:hypothetical protein